MLSKKILSLQHPFVKELAELAKVPSLCSTRKQVLIFGKKLVSEWGKKNQIELLVRTNEFGDELDIYAQEGVIFSKGAFEKICPQKNPEGIGALIRLQQWGSPLLFSRFILLSSIQDPGNVGALLRCAKAFGIEAAILTDGCANPYSYKVIAASRGYSLELPLFSLSEEAAIHMIRLRSIPFFATDLNGEQLSQIIPPKSFCIAFGSEGKGISKELEIVARKITIPMRGGVESLNVAVAGGIVMNHFGQGLV